MKLEDKTRRSSLAALSGSMQPQWRYNAAHARSSDGFVAGAASGPVFITPDMVAQRAAGVALLQTIGNLAPFSEHVVPPGHYRLPAPSVLTTAANVVIHGSGATLWLENPIAPTQPPEGGLVFAGCTGLVLSNVAIDAYPHSASQVEVLGVDRPNNTVVTRSLGATDAGYPTVPGNVTSFTWRTVGGLQRNVEMKLNTTVSGGNVHVVGAAGWLASLESRLGNAVSAGDLVSLPFRASNVAPTANSGLLTFRDSPGCRLSNVVVHSGGPAVLDASGLTIEGSRIVRRPGSNRLVGSASEGVVSSTVSTTIANTEIGHCGGAAVDAGGWFGVVCEHANLRTLTVASPLGIGTRCSFFDPCNRLLGAGGVVSAIKSANVSLANVAAVLAAPHIASWDVYTVTVDSDISAATLGTVVDTGLTNSACHVLDSYVHDSGDVRVTCPGRISGTFIESCGVYVGPDAASTYRGPYPRDVAVSNNFVVSGGIVVGARTKANSAVHLLQGRKPMSNVRVTNNTVRFPRGIGIQMYYTDNGSTVSGNMVAAQRPGPHACGIAELSIDGSPALVTGATDATVSNNRTFGATHHAYATKSPDGPRAPHRITDLSYPGPRFTPQEIADQIASGEALWADVLVKAANLSVSEYVVPPGNYGMEAHEIPPWAPWWEPYAFSFIGIERPDDNPFTLSAYGCTFWTKATIHKPAVVRMMAFSDTANIRVRGLTFDVYYPNYVNSVVTAIDLKNNQIQMELLPGSYSNVSTITFENVSDWYGTTIFSKPDGTGITPFYTITTKNEFGLNFKKVTQDTDRLDRFWCTFKNTNVATNTYTPQWHNAHGIRGTMEVGDLLSLSYVNYTVELNASKNIHLTECTMFNGFIGEWAGHGGHVYKDCVLTRRPGTNMIVAGGGHMGGRSRVGSVYDGCYFGFSNDDAWSLTSYTNASAKAISGNTVTIGTIWKGVLPGDKFEFYRTSTKDFVGSYIVESIVPNSTHPSWYPAASVTFTTTPSPAILTTVNDPVVALIPAVNCSNWAVRNCTFDSSFQRIMIQGGPGIFENNLVRGMGHGMAIASVFAGPAPAAGGGGISDDVVIRNNVFLESSLSSERSVVDVTVGPFTETTGLRVANLRVVDNAFVGCGGAFLDATGTRNAIVANNIVVDPIRRSHISKISTRETPIIRRVQNEGLLIANNTIVEYAPYASRAFFDPIVDVNPFQSGSNSRRNVWKLDPARTCHEAAYRAYSAMGNAAQIIVAVRTSAAALDP